MKAWKCEVCGFVHEGVTPPGACPVCGVGPDMFSQLAELSTPVAPMAQTTPRPKAWVCTVCGYLHVGDSPPDVCPVCGVGPELFEPEEESQATSAAHGPSIVVLGGGIAGVTAAAEARRQSPAARVQIVSREAGLPYYRLNLTRLLAGEVNDEQLPLHPASWFSERQIELREGEAVAIDRRERRVRLRSGVELSYDTLILATGAHPFVPPIPGAERQGVFAVRTIDDVRRVLAWAGTHTRCVCLGGGLLGLELAGALSGRGVDVTVLEGFPWLLPRQLAERAARLLQRHVEGLGVAVRCGVSAAELTGGAAVDGVRLASGETIAADLVLVATGVRPNTHLARQCGLDVEVGVLVDDRLSTSDPHIFATGDVAEHRGIVYGLWPVAYAQGLVAGANAAGADHRFSGMPPATTLKVLRADLFSIGQFQPVDASYRAFEQGHDRAYVRLVCRDGKLVGANLFGDVAAAARVREAIEQGSPIRELAWLGESFPGFSAACHKESQKER